MNFFKKIFEEPVIFLTGKFFKYTNSKFQVVLFIILQIIARLEDLVYPLIFGIIINTIQLEGITEANISRLIGLCSLIVVFTIISRIFFSSGRVIEERNAFWTNYNYRRNLFKTIFKLPYQWHSESKSGEVLNRVNSSSSSFRSFLSNYFDVVFNISGLIIATIGVILISPVSSVVIFPTITIIILWYYWIEKRLVKNYKKFHEYDNELSERSYDLLSNVNTIKTLRAEKTLVKDIERVMKKPFELLKRNIFNNEIKWGMLDFLVSVQTVGVLIL